MTPPATKTEPALVAHFLCAGESTSALRSKPMSTHVPRLRGLRLRRPSGSQNTLLDAVDAGARRACHPAVTTTRCSPANSQWRARRVSAGCIRDAAGRVSTAQVVRSGESWRACAPPSGLAPLCAAHIACVSDLYARGVVAWRSAIALNDRLEQRYRMVRGLVCVVNGSVNQRPIRRYGTSVSAGEAAVLSFTSAILPADGSR